MKDDQKPQFLRAFANWIDEWDKLKMPNCEQFTLTAQTSSALRRTLRCHAALIEDLLQNDGYKFVLTSRFQSDPLERRYGQYRQMSGGRFLVGLKDVSSSEKILKIKSLVKEGFDINDSVKVDQKTDEELEKFKRSVNHIIIDSDRIRLSDETKEISDNVGGYIAKKLTGIYKGCCENLLTGSNEDAHYINLLSRGGLKVPSAGLGNYVAHGFAILHAATDLIRNSDLPSRVAGEELLKRTLHAEGFVCAKHEKTACTRTNRIITNVFLNNQRKRTTDSVVKDKVVAFKKSKRSKSL